MGHLTDIALARRRSEYWRTINPICDRGHATAFSATALPDNGSHTNSPRIKSTIPNIAKSRMYKMLNLKIILRATYSLLSTLMVVNALIIPAYGKNIVIPGNTLRDVQYKTTQTFTVPGEPINVFQKRDGVDSSDPKKAGAATISNSESFTNDGGIFDAVGDQYSVTATSAFGKLGVSISGTSLAVKPNTAADQSVEATAQFFDTVRIVSNNPALNDGTHHVIEHGIINLSGTASVSGPSNINNVKSEASALVQVFGTGISGGGVNAGFLDTQPNQNMPFVQSIAWTMDVTLGVDKEIHLDMTVIGSSCVNNLFGSANAGSAQFEADFQHTLKWGDGTYFTDEAGNVLDGLTIDSASGFDYLHPTFDSGSVPEPASWALMLGGFGMIGGTLRASKRRSAIAFG